MGTIKASEELHTIKNPLKLILDNSHYYGYKVNKPNQGDQKLVSLEYAKDLKAQIKQLSEENESLYKMINVLREDFPDVDLVIGEFAKQQALKETE